MCRRMTAMCPAAILLSALAMSGCSRLEQDACGRYGGYGAPVTGLCLPMTPDTHDKVEWQVEVHARAGAGPGGFGSYRQLGGLGAGQFERGIGAPGVITDAVAFGLPAPPR